MAMDSPHTGLRCGRRAGKEVVSCHQAQHSPENAALVSVTRGHLAGFDLWLTFSEASL